MDEFSKKIWKDLLPPEREVIPRATRARKAKDEPPHAEMRIRTVEKSWCQRFGKDRVAELVLPFEEVRRGRLNVS